MWRLVKGLGKVLRISFSSVLSFMSDVGHDVWKGSTATNADIDSYW